MPVTKLTIQNFRNIEYIDWEPSLGLNVLEGENAQGKTNFLEAIYFLANGRSFRTSDETHLIQFGKDNAGLHGLLRQGDLESPIEVRFSLEKREVRFQGKALRGLAKLHEWMRVLVFTPDSCSLFRGTPFSRRRYFDHATTVQCAGYADLLQRYYRVLRQRNQILERGEVPPSLKESFDLQWAELASQVMQARHAYLEDLLPLWKMRLESLFRLAFPLEVRWEGRIGEASPNPQTFLTKLEEFQEEERRYRVTLLGPQRDDLVARVEGALLREIASQGQQRMLVIALKLAEADLFQEKFRRAPIFLLDDLGSELDAGHLEKLLQVLGDLHAQTFLTTAQRGTYRPLRACTWEVRKGSFFDC